MKALILGGGSIKGAWQAGAIRALLESGYEPDIIVGISVGALNGSYLATDKFGHTWEGMGKRLTDFWLTNICQPEDVIIKRSKLSLIWDALTKNFRGFADSKPIDTLIDKIVDLQKIRAGEVELYVGAVNVNSGKIVYANPYMPNFKSYVKASKAIPYAMPTQTIGFQVFTDGGLIDSAPIGVAIDKKATEIVVITPHPQYVGASDTNSRDAIEFADRCITVVQNNTLNDDIQIAELINQICPANGTPITDGEHAGKRRIPIKVIRPEVPTNIELTRFKKADIKMMIDAGYSYTQKLLS